MTPEQLKARTKYFALRIIKLVGALSKTIEGRAIANQLARCGTSVAANYRATCVVAREVNLSPKWASFWKKPMRRNFGSN